LVNWQYLLFTGTWQRSMLASRFCKIHGEKHPRAFVKVVEVSEISNFGIHCLVHFSTNFWSKSQSNQPAPQRVALERDVAPRRAPACAAARQGRPPLAFEPTGLVPRPHLPQATRTPRPFEVRARPDRDAALTAGPLPSPSLRGRANQRLAGVHTALMPDEP
jgi:hypothetical protein